VQSPDQKKPQHPKHKYKLVQGRRGIKGQRRGTTLLPIRTIEWALKTIGSEATFTGLSVEGFHDPLSLKTTQPATLPRQHHCRAVYQMKSWLTEQTRHEQQQFRIRLNLLAGKRVENPCNFTTEWLKYHHKFDKQLFLEG
jgi:hypothetical protein